MRKGCFPQPCKNNQKDKVDEESARQLVLRDLQLERRTSPGVALASTLSVLQVSDKMFWNAAQEVSWRDRVRKEEQKRHLRA